MKPSAVLLTVILLATGLFSCITKDKPNTYIPEDALPEIPLKKEDTLLIPQADHKEVDSPKAVNVKFKQPKRHRIVEKVDPTQCGGIIRQAEEPIDTLVWRKVEIEAEYPGGAAAWQRFLNRNLRYPQELLDDDILTCSAVVQFIVDKEGNVSDVEGVSGPEAFRAEAVRLIKKSGRWVPAIQGGRQVKSLRKQPFTIHLEAEP